MASSTVELSNVRSSPNGNGTIHDIVDDNYIPDNELEDFQPLVTGDDPSSPVIKKNSYDDHDTKLKGLQVLFHMVQQKIVMISISLIILIGLFVMKSSNNSISNSRSTNNNINTIEITSTLDAMKSNYELAKQQLLNKLKIDYGADNLQSMLLQDDRSYTFYQSAPNGTSDYRFHRKITIKVLRAILQEVAKSKEDKGASGEDDNEDSGTTPIDDESSLVQYIWATGGHSSAAGHGNLFDESYTARLEQALKPVLRSIGIDFIGRNYAMGGTYSAPELGLCSKEIFGIDIDSLSWDFGMTDGSNYHFAMLYFYRTAMAVKGVTCLAFNTGGVGSFLEHQKVIKFLDDSGAIGLISPDAQMSSAIAAVPDSFGLTDDQINKMPQFVRNFRCERKIEDGDPYCGKEKYNDTMCAGRRYKASWHQGWYVNFVYISTVFTKQKIYLFRSFLLQFEISSPSVLMLCFTNRAYSFYYSFVIGNGMR